MECVFEAGNTTEAHIVALMLERHGIDAHVAGHFLQGGVGELAPMGFAEVHAPPEQAGRARELVAQYESGTLAED